MTVALISFSNQWLRRIACACVRFFKGVFLSPTSWMLGCIVSMCVHPRHSRGPVPGSTQRRLGRTGDICWAQPGPNPRSIPRKAVAKVKDSPHSALGTGNIQLDVQVWLNVEAEAGGCLSHLPIIHLWVTLAAVKSSNRFKTSQS